MSAGMATMTQRRLPRWTMSPEPAAQSALAICLMNPMRDSDASSDWAESRSRITTPDSSTPSSPRRRSGEEDEALRRQTVVKGVAAPPGQPHLRDERPGAVSKPRRVSSTAEEGTDPADLEARSVRLIEQLQNFIRERENAIASPRNDPHISGGRMAPREAEAGIYGRHGPQSSQSFRSGPRGTGHDDKVSRGGNPFFRQWRPMWGPASRCGGDARAERSSERDDGDRRDYRRSDAEDRGQRRNSPEVRVVRESSHAPRNVEKVDVVTARGSAAYSRT